jgi:hypothetical protein
MFLLNKNDIILSIIVLNTIALRLNPNTFFKNFISDKYYKQINFNK